MTKLIVFVGVPGSGKTTMLQKLHEMGFGTTLRPFTTRPRRYEGEEEYEFLKTPPTEEECAWIIQKGAHSYGMKWQELERLSRSDIGFTVFDPDSIDKLDNVREQGRKFEIVTVGLDTVLDLETLESRVDHEEGRIPSVESFEKQRSVVQTQDVVLSSDERTNVDAIRSVVEMVSGRGGIVSGRHLSDLIGAGTLLQECDINRVQAASYDLRIADDLWCQGSFKDLTSDDPSFQIPPYSYCIVRAQEQARIPSFMSGHFDIRVSYFLDGLILSNGPQVDPGYQGDLFCMLFNGSSDAKAIKKGEHFATIQFWTVTSNGRRYSGPYSYRQKLRDHMEASTQKGSGGAIKEELEQKLEKAKTELRQEMPRRREVMNVVGFVFAAFGVIFTVLMGFALDAQYDAREAAKSATEAAEQAREAASSIP